MFSNKAPLAAPATADGLNLVCGAGGSRAILGTSGAILAFHVLDINNSWRTIGGVSGGSIPSVMLAAGMSPREIAHQVIEIDFNSMLTPRVNMLRILWAFFLKECAWKRRPCRGVLGSQKVGAFIDKHVTAWPKNYWTLAVAGDQPFLFTSEGVFAYHPDGTRDQISDVPAPVSLAVRASCAVPGIIDGVSYQGICLLDGGLAAEGRCPVGVVKHQLGGVPGSIVAVDVGEGATEDKKNEPFLLGLLRRIVCGPCCDPEADPPLDSDGVFLVHPDVTGVQSLEFKLTRDQKWQAFMTGFVATVGAMSASGLVAPDKLAAAQSIVAEFKVISNTSTKPNELANKVEAMLSSRGLY